MKILFHIRETFLLKNILRYTLPFVFLSFLISTQWQVEITSIGGYPTDNHNAEDWIPRPSATGLIRPAFFEATAWGGGSGATAIRWGNFAINLLCRFAIALLISFLLGNYLRKTKTVVRVIFWTMSFIVACCFVLGIWFVHMENSDVGFTYKVISSHLGFAFSR